MAVSWQTVRTGSFATGAAEAAGEDEAPGEAGTPGEDEDRLPEGPAPEDAEAWPALPREFADGDAQRAALRELALRALI